MRRKIITAHVFPPIPARHFDWQAHYDGDEPDDNGVMAVGSGATEAEAIADLIASEEPMTELTDYQRIVERPNLQRLREDHARALGAMRDRSFAQGMVGGIAITILAAAFIFPFIR